MAEMSSSPTRKTQKQSPLQGNSLIMPNAFLPLVKIKPIVTYAGNHKFLQAKRQALDRQKLTIQVDKGHFKEFDSINRKAEKSTKTTNSAVKTKNIKNEDAAHVCSHHSQKHRKTEKLISTSIQELRGCGAGNNGKRTTQELYHSLLVADNNLHIKSSSPRKQCHRSAAYNIAKLESFVSKTRIYTEQAQQSSDTESIELQEDPQLLLKTVLSSNPRNLPTSYPRFKPDATHDLSLNINFKEITQVQFEKQMAKRRANKMDQHDKKKRLNNMEKLVAFCVKKQKNLHGHIQAEDRKREKGRRRLFITMSPNKQQQNKTKNNKSDTIMPQPQKPLKKQNSYLQKTPAPSKAETDSNRLSHRQSQSPPGEGVISHSICQLSKNPLKLVSPYLARTLRKHQCFKINDQEEESTNAQLLLLANMEQQGNMRVQRYGKIRKSITEQSQLPFSTAEINQYYGSYNKRVQQRMLNRDYSNQVVADIRNTVNVSPWAEYGPCEGSSEYWYPEQEDGK